MPKVRLTLSVCCLSVGMAEIGMSSEPRDLGADAWLLLAGAERHFAPLATSCALGGAAKQSRYHAYNEGIITFIDQYWRQWLERF